MPEFWNEEDRRGEKCFVVVDGSGSQDEKKMDGTGKAEIFSFREN